MKNKKGLSAIVATLIMILLFLVIIGIIWVVVINIFEQDQFTITKEVCEGEDFNVNLKNNFSHTWKNLQHFSELRIIYDDYNDILYLKTSKCEQVKVDEDFYFRSLVGKNVIKYNRSDDSHTTEDFEIYSNYCWNIGGEQIFTCKENPKDLLCCYKKISKQDLTVEWLDENAECVDWDWKGKSCPKGYKSYENPQGITYCNAPYKDSACSKYKYEDYTIEVGK